LAKSPSAFRTISEAAEEVGAPQHVLRFWETKFDFIVPVKRAGGRRFYRPDDVMVLKAVRRLLARVAAYGEPGATLEIDSGLAPAPEASLVSPAPDHDRLERVLTELEAARARLEAVLRR